MDKRCRVEYAPRVVQPMTGPQFRFFLLLLVVLTMGIGGLLFWLIADEARLAEVREWMKPGISDSSLPVRSEQRDDGERTASGAQTGVELIRLERENALLAAELSQTKAALKRAEAELEGLRRPMEEDVVSSAVQATLEEGEVLVTGGFQTADGLVQFTFVEQKVKRGANGAEVVEFSGRQVALTPEVVTEMGLDSMMTTAGNVLQHGEAWSRDEYEALVAELAETSGVDLISAPRVTTALGAQATIAINEYQMALSAERPLGQTGLTVDMRVEMPRNGEAVRVEPGGE